MRLADFLAPSRVLLPLTVETLDAARTALLERLAASGAITDLERLRGRVSEERGEDMVSFADRAFLQHYRTDTAATLQVALGVSPGGVCRALDDGGEQRAPVVVVVVGPPRSAARQLQVVRAFGRLLPRPDVTDALVDATTPEEIVELAVFADYQIADQLLAGDLMTERPRPITPEAPLREAAPELARSGLGGMPVVDDNGRLLGMLSERELLRHLLVTDALSDADTRRAPLVQTATKTVRDAMTRQVLCVAPDQPVAEVAALMSNKDVERVPVVRDGRLVGLLTRGDIVRKIIGS